MPPNEAAQWVQAREHVRVRKDLWFRFWSHSFALECACLWFVVSIPHDEAILYNIIIIACVELFAFIVNQSILSIPVLCWHMQATQSLTSQAWQKHGSDRLMLPLLLHWEWQRSNVLEWFIQSLGCDEVDELISQLVRTCQDPIFCWSPVC